MEKKTASIIGIVLGIAIIIVGFCVMNPETYQLGTRDSLGSLIEFGADFYTEIYHMTYSTAHQVQKAYVNICNAIGWLIVAIGLFDIAYFVCKMASCKDDGARVGHNTLPNQKAPTASTLPEKKDIPITIDSVPSPKTTINETQSTSNAQGEGVAVDRSDGHFTCPKCGLVQRSDRTVCWSCGQKFLD